MQSDKATREQIGPTRLGGHWAANLRYEDLPTAVVEHAKLCLLDGLGCGIFGSAQQWGQIAGDAAEEMAPGGKASLWGRSSRVGQAAAALANGTATHGFEIDDLHLEAIMHPTACALPAALALAEYQNSSGQDLLTSMVAGYEVGLRVGICAGVPHSVTGFHVTGTVGCLVSGAAAARILGLDGEATTHALGISATQASGLYCARDGAMAKRFHAGHAAQAGVIGGLLARRGFTGATDVLEASTGGFMSTLSDDADLNILTDGLGQKWETLNIVFKAYAACASTHTIIDGIGALMKQGLTSENLAGLQIRMTKTGSHCVGWPYVPNGVVAAQMNGSYAAAVRLLEGDAFIDQYREELLADRRVLDIISRIKVEHDPALDAGGASTRHATHVDATLTDGSKLHAFTQQRRGSADYPLSKEELINKFRRTAGSVLTPENRDELCELILDAEKLSNLNRISTLLRNEKAGEWGGIQTRKAS